MRRLGMQQVDRPGAADVIFLNGGATMTECWRSGFGRLHSYGSRFPDKPLVVWPSSFDIRQSDFAALVEMRRARTLLITRDRRSLACLENLNLPSVCELALSDDAAFELARSELLRDWASRSAGKHTLVVVRGDREGLPGNSGSGYEKPPFEPASWWRRPRHFLKHVIRPKLRAKVSEKRATTVNVETAAAMDGSADLARLLQGQAAEFLSVRLPVLSVDVSDPAACSFETFCQLIAEADCVITTRLHAGIFAGLLGKRTIMVGQSYGKLEGIFDLSMASMSHVELVRSPARLETR